MNERVAIYTRVSTEMQARQGYSLDAQQHQLLTWCHDRNYEVYKVYTDEGRSGKDLQRPMIKKLLEDVTTGYFSIILVWSLSRFTRSVADLYNTCMHLDKNNVSLVSCTEQFDTSTPVGRAMRGIIGVFAQMEREIISERVRAAIEERALQGKPTCNYLLGYDKNSNGHFIINEQEADIVRFIFNVYQLLRSIVHTSNACNEAGYVGKLGAPFTPSSIQNILTNFMYCGFNSWKRTPIPGTHTAIISKGLYNQVQEIMLDNTSGRTRKHPLIFL